MKPKIICLHVFASYVAFDWNIILVSLPNKLLIYQQLRDPIFGVLWTNYNQVSSDSHYPQPL